MPRGGGGVPRSAKEANNPILLKVQSLQLSFRPAGVSLEIWNASRICVSSLRRGHANLLCIVPILVYVLPKQVHQPNVPRLYLTGHRQ